MNDHESSRSMTPVIASLLSSQADLEAGRIDDFHQYLARLRLAVEDRAAKLKENEDAPSDQG